MLLFLNVCFICREKIVEAAVGPILRRADQRKRRPEVMRATHAEAERLRAEIDKLAAERPWIPSDAKAAAQEAVEKLVAW